MTVPIQHRVHIKKIKKVTHQKVIYNCENLMAAQDKHKKYVDTHHVDNQFSMGDKVFLRVRPWKSLIHYGKGSKLAPHFVRPFEILERIGPEVCRLSLPPNLSNIHDVFHVSVFRPYFFYVTHVLDWYALQVEEKQLSFEPVCILQHWEMNLRSCDMEQVRVQ